MQIPEMTALKDIWATERMKAGRDAAVQAATAAKLSASQRDDDEVRHARIVPGLAQDQGVMRVMPASLLENRRRAKAGEPNADP